MLQNTFYKITQSTTAENGDLLHEVRFDTAHPVFQGHFPNQPVVPGVFTVQVINELVELAAGKKLLLTKARKIKFLYMIDPKLGNTLQIKLTVKNDGDEVTADATALFMNQPCLKINARYKPEL